MLKKNLELELRAIAEEICQHQQGYAVEDLHAKISALYEKSLVYKYAQEHELDLESDEAKNAIVIKFEKMAEAVLATQKNIPEANPHQEDIAVPLMKTIEDMVAQMEPQEEEVQEDFISKIVSTPTLNDKFTKSFKLDLNNRLAFVNHLFNQSNEELDRVLSVISTMDSENEAMSFIDQLVKPEYNNWLGEEQYETRFKAFVSLQFS